MESRAKVAGHPIHPMLVTFPIGLLLTALIFDIIHLVSDEPRWAEVSWYMIPAGIIGGLVAAVPGLIDWLAIPAGTRAKRIGLTHALGNVVVLALFLLSWLLRRDSPGVLPTEAVVAEFLGAGIMAVTGWLGGELVDRLGVGVDDGAHLDAPSSLSGVPAGAGQDLSRAGMSHGYTGAERRHFPQPAFAGIDRRTHGARG
jgi:uncharacterized membrane protein